MTGVAFEPDGPFIHCAQTSGFDVVAFSKVRLPQEAVYQIREQPEVLSGFPRKMEYERERKSETWAAGSLSTEAQTALELALVGAVAALDESGCVTVPSAIARQSVLRAVGRPTTFYSYQFKPVESEVVPEALEFRVLDLEDGVLYELVNFS